MTDLGVEPEAHAGVCNRDGCTANEGGPCAEGHADTIDCPYTELTPVEAPVPVAPDPRRIPLYDGEALRSDQLERALCSHPVSMVVPLGRVQAGKTTLITVSYHLLRSRRLARWRFTGSETIVGLARRAHHSSFASKRDSPITPRTEKEESGLHLHLGMRRVDDDTRHPVVIVDLSGEHVEALARGESVEVAGKALARADHIPVVIDGGQLADAGTRALAVLEARSLLKMLEKQALQDHTKICVVITMGDLLVGHEIEATVKAIVRGTRAEDGAVFITADRSSPEKDENGEPIVSLGDGIEDFIEHIAKRPEVSALDSPQAGRPDASPMLNRIWARS